MTMSQSRTLSVSIACPPAEVYSFVSNPENLPRWAAGLCLSVRKSNGNWIVETPRGPVKIRFADRNPHGVVDHYVTLDSGEEIYVPMRVVANGSGSEVIFTLFRSPEMSEKDFSKDVGQVERDLRSLKDVLEGGG